MKAGRFSTHDNPVVQAIWSHVARLGTQTKVAAELGVTLQYVNEVLHGKKMPGDRVSRHYGFTKKTVVTYEKIETS
jgi:DNA-binding transcriptional regulator YdaS (Cro superfamily)